MPAKYLAVLILVLALPLSLNPTHGIAAQHAPCGDHDGNGRVVASDALRVLKKGVGIDVAMACVCPPTTTTSTSSTTSSTLLFIADECFEDSDCYPEAPYCAGYDCAECDEDEHCGEGFTCATRPRGRDQRCLPLPGPCADHDRDRLVSATDALIILKKAVGQDIHLRCTCSSTTTTTTTTTTSSTTTL